MNTARGSRRNNIQRRQPVTISGPSTLPSQRRRRSRSPDPQAVQQQGQNSTRRPDASHADQNKRKKSGNQPVPSSSSRSFLVAIDDTNSDRGRKSKVKPCFHNRHLAENSGPSRALDIHGSSSKRDRSKSRESLKLVPKGPVSDAEGSGRDAHVTMDDHPDYSGPLAAVEFAKMRRELDSLKKLVHESKKTAKKQSKVIEEFKQQDNALRQKLKESESLISKLQNKTKKSDEAIATVESNSLCQICMELLYRPYALSPCGHILCVTCLQEWFRKAPTVDDEMFDDSDPDYLLRRRKTCPCCRTSVRHRPIPVFMIKAIVAAIAKVKGPHPGVSPSRELASNDSDPWEGLFPDDEEEIDDYVVTDEDDEDDDEDVDEDHDEDSSWYDEVFSYGTGSGEEGYRGAHVFPQWEPPSVVIDEDDYLFDQLDESDLNCLRRGVTIGMLHKYEVEYNHEAGLIARDEAFNRIYLGWNIRLSADDENGEMYMRYIADDMQSRPERWSIDELDEDGTFDAHLLVPEEEVLEYQDTDSDNYMEVDLD